MNYIIFFSCRGSGSRPLLSFINLDDKPPVSSVPPISASYYILLIS